MEPGQPVLWGDHEGDSVGTAFEKSGFGDYSSFFKAFTKAVGVSPKKYAGLSVS